MTRRRLNAFQLTPGFMIGNKYIVDEFLGGGWEGEVYKVIERRTGIHRAAKLFFPHRNRRDRAVRHYARTLDKLRRCPLVIQYHHSEELDFGDQRITCLISELVEGEILADFVRRQPGKRLPPYEALNILHALVCGLEVIHGAREYHGDIHDGNILIQRRGIHFHLKLIDFFDFGPSAGGVRSDILQTIALLYEIVGGRKHYSRQPACIKRICRGLRASSIRKLFPTARRLREYLEEFEWE